MIHRIIFVVLFLFSITSFNAQEENAPKFGNGLFNLVGKDSTWTMKIGARMQILTFANWFNDENPSTNFLIRRSRLKFDGFALTPKLKYKIELGLSNRDISGASEFTSNAPRYILDAVIKWNFYKNVELWFGQTKLPGNRERVISSGNMQMVDRSLLNAFFNIDRDVGFQLRNHHTIGKQFIVREIVSLSQGEGRNVTSGNLGGFQYTGRLEFLPFGKFKGKGDYSASDLKREETPKLAIGLTYDYNDDAVKTRSNQGRYMVTETGFYHTDISTFFADAMFKYKGFSLMAEYADRDAKDPIAKNEDGTETGRKVAVGKSLNLQSGYLFKKNWEVSGRYTNVNWDDVTELSDQNAYTLGLSKYIVGHKLKVQSDLSYIDFASGDEDVLFELQFDIHF